MKTAKARIDPLGVRKAVIPVAGMGTRLLPLTKSQPKEMLPVVDKPAIQYVVEEAIAAGIESILMVTGRSKRAIEDYFDHSVELEEDLEAHGKLEELAVIRRISNLAQVYYVRQSRMAGESKYPFWKMVSFAWRGITACSVAPLRIAGLMSMLCMLAALAFSGVSLLKYAMGETIQGWTSLIIVVLLLGSVQLFCMALVGEYLAKVFTEVRQRPRYIIAKKL